PLELGRGPQRDIKRVMIEDGGVSRDQLRLEELPNGRLRLEKLRLKNPGFFEKRTQKAMGGKRELPPPPSPNKGKPWVEVRVPGGKSGASPVLAPAAQHAPHSTVPGAADGKAKADGAPSTPKPASAASAKASPQAATHADVAIPGPPAPRPAPTFLDPL